MSKSKFYVGIDVGKDELWGIADGQRPRRRRQALVQACERALLHSRQAQGPTIDAPPGAPGNDLASRTQHPRPGCPSDHRPGIRNQPPATGDGAGFAR